MAFLAGPPWRRCQDDLAHVEATLNTAKKTLVIPADKHGGMEVCGSQR